VSEFAISLSEANLRFNLAAFPRARGKLSAVAQEE
jgi:hypothetical protein